MKKHQRTQLLAICFLGALGFFLPAPHGLDQRGWQGLVLFMTTVLGVILQPMPMSVITLLGGLAAVLTKTLTLQNVLSDFGSKVVWIVVLAFFVARSFIKTGLGQRIAYNFIARWGRSLLGLGYGILFTECALAPLIPSIAARSGGILFPVVQAILNAYDQNHQMSKSELEKTGAYLMNICHHGSVLSSALFLTAMAGNPLVVALAKRADVSISWMMWFQAASLPALICLALLPLVLMWLSPPGIRISDEAPKMAKVRLESLGPLTSPERSMLGIFSFLIFGWASESFTGIDATTVALTGVLMLLLSDVLSWDDVIGEKQAWDTMIWFAVLLAFSGQLEQLGVMSWMASGLQALLPQTWSPYALGGILCVIYFYIHYFFASLTAHITVFYALFLTLMIQLGLPALSSALILAYLSNLYGGLTHYGTSAAPILFGSGYQSIRHWWAVGAIVSSMHLCIWMLTLRPWMHFLGVV